jgi:hypothetical protein
VHKSLLEYIDIVAEETSPTSIILAVAELMRKEADASRETAKTSIFVFLDKLQNAGLAIDYPGLKAYFDADPRLSNVIQQFNDREIEFVGQGDEDEAPDTGAPVGDIPPEEKVSKMANAALAKRESIGEAEGSDDLKQAVNTAIAMFKRSGRGGEQIIPSENFDGFNDNEAMAGIRHWGNWENPQDEEDEEDYDWQNPTDETYEKATKLIAEISKQFPDIKFELEVEEKNTMIVSARHKVKEDNVAEMTFSQLKGSLKGKVMSDEKLEELKQLIEKHGLAEVSKMFSIDSRELQAMTESNFTESINDIIYLSGIK